jgi:hypothetical protein
MAYDPQLRTDFLPDTLTDVQPTIRFEAETQYNAVVRANPEKSRTIHPAKNIFEVMDLIQTAIEQYEERQDIVDDARVLATFDEPDEKIANLSQELNPKGIVSLSLERRAPGAFGQGPPFEGTARNLRPIVREEEEDPDSPGYRRAMFGYYYDNIIRANCWTRSNKTANELMIWFETLIQEYQWWFRFSGVARILYWGLGPKKKINIGGNKLYSHSIDYFVRTEKVVAIREKKFEQLIVRFQRLATS